MILSYLFLFLAGACKGLMDLINFKFRTTKLSYLDSYFWDMKTSWRNKWKNGNPIDGEKFYGSSTFFVWLTDGWHLVQFFMIKFIFLAVLFHQEFTIFDLVGVWSYHLGFWAIYESKLLKK